MIITYRPDDGDEQKFEFFPLKVLDDAAEEIEDHYKGTFDEFHAGLLQGQTRARRVLLWHLQRQIHPSLQFADLPRFERRQLEVEFDRDELLDMREQAEAAKLSASDKARALLFIDTELAKLPPAEGVAPKGKASPSGGTTTQSKSRSTAASRRQNSGS